MCRFCRRCCVDRERCTEPNDELSPATPPLDADLDDHRDDTCPGKTCLDEAEALAVLDSPGHVETGSPRQRAQRGTPSSGPPTAPARTSPAAPQGNVVMLTSLAVASWQGAREIAPPPLNYSLSENFLLIGKILLQTTTFGAENPHFGGI